MAIIKILINDPTSHRRKIGEYLSHIKEVVARKEAGTLGVREKSLMEEEAR